MINDCQSILAKIKELEHLLQDIITGKGTYTFAEFTQKKQNVVIVRGELDKLSELYKFFDNEKVLCELNMGRIKSVETFPSYKPHSKLSMLDIRGDVYAVFSNHKDIFMKKYNAGDIRHKGFFRLMQGKWKKQEIDTKVPFGFVYPLSAQEIVLFSTAGGAYLIKKQATGIFTTEKKLSPLDRGGMGGVTKVERNDTMSYYFMTDMGNLQRCALDEEHAIDSHWGFEELTEKIAEDSLAFTCSCRHRGIIYINKKGELNQYDEHLQESNHIINVRQAIPDFEQRAIKDIQQFASGEIIIYVLESKWGKPKMEMYQVIKDEKNEYITQKIRIQKDIAIEHAIMLPDHRLIAVDASGNVIILEKKKNARTYVKMTDIGEYKGTVDQIIALEDGTVIVNGSLGMQSWKGGSKK